MENYIKISRREDGIELVTITLTQYQDFLKLQGKYEELKRIFEASQLKIINTPSYPSIKPTITYFDLDNHTKTKGE